jgi:hypothetical protein
VRSDYHFSRPLLVRALGALLVACGLVLVGVAALVAALDLSRLVLSVTVLLVAATVLGAVAAYRRFRTLVHLDEVGYQVRVMRRAGVRQARWRDVEDVVTATVSGHDCVVLRLKDGRTTTVPVDVLDVDPPTFVRDLSAYLDAGHGYRRLS